MKSHRKFKLFGKGIEGLIPQFIIISVLLISVFLVMVPIIITIISSLKTNYEVLSIWSLPKNPIWSNWAVGLKGLTINLLNSISVALICSFLVVFISSIAAYVFVRHNFWGKEFLFMFILALIMIPGVLSLTPSFLLINTLGLKNTWWALIFPYISGSQVGTIFLFRTFLQQQPVDLFESAKVDGANDLTMYFMICIPLAVPVLCISAVGMFSTIYNDFLWPSLVISDQSKQMLMPVLRSLSTEVAGTIKQQGVIYAMYLLSSIPLLITTLIGLKYFIKADWAAGMKL